MELPAYAMALSMVTSARGIALDVGTGNGALLDLLAPTYCKVVAADRSLSRIERAKERATSRGYANVQFLCADIEHDTIFKSIATGADALFSSRMLHHASKSTCLIDSHGKDIGSEWSNLHRGLL